MQARYHDEQGAVVDTLNVAVYPKKRWNVAIRSVTPSGFQPLTLDGGKLKTYLNEIVYNQGIFSWENVEVYNSLVILYEQPGGKDRCVDIGYEQDEADTIIATPEAMISTRETTTIFLDKASSKTYHPGDRAWRFVLRRNNRDGDQYQP